MHAATPVTLSSSARHVSRTLPLLPSIKHEVAQTPRSHNQQMEPGSRTRQTVKFATAAGIGTSLLVISGLLLTGTVIALVMATPVLVIFSPILVPAAAVVLLAVSGLIVSGGFGAAAVSVLAWIYNYVAGKHPVGADRLDMARSRLVQKAREVRERARDYGHYVQNKAHEATS